MGFATIDPHSQKVQTKLYKILKFGVNQGNLTEIQPQFTKKCMAIRRPSGHILVPRGRAPFGFWSAPRIATSGQVQPRKSAIHGLPVTLRMFRVKFDKSDWFWSQSIVFTKPFKTGMSLDLARGRDSWC